MTSTRSLQEMLHLAQAWNLLAAIGGTPYYLRPNFPQGTKYYPMEAELKLEPFGHRALQYVFTNPASDPRIVDWFARTSIGLMPMGIKPIGEALTMLPSGLKSGSTAGPSFGMTRHVPLSPEPQAASILAWERLVELVDMARQVADHPGAPAQIGWATDNIARLLPRRSRDRAG